MRIKSIVITLLSSIFLLSWTTEAFAAQEIVEVNAYDIESSTGGGSTQNFSFYNENPPNQPYTCGAALFTYFFNANILVEKINAPVFAMPALFDCPNSTGAILSTEIESGSTYRISLQNIPAGKICTHSEAGVKPTAPATGPEIALGSQVGCILTFLYDDSMLGGGTIEGQTLAVRYYLASQVSSISNFNVAANNPNTNVYPGFDISWNDTNVESGYTLRWTDSVTSRSFNLPANATSTKLVEDFSLPLANRAVICDGRTYTFTLTAHSAYSQSVSSPIQARCNRGYSDPAPGSGFLINGTQLQTRMQTSFNTITDKTIGDIIAVTIPVSIPNASSSNPVQGALETQLRITHRTSGGIVTTYYASDVFPLSTTSTTVNVPITFDWPGIQSAGDTVQLDATVTLTNFRGDSGPIASISTILPSNPNATNTGVNFYSANPPTPDPYGSAPADGLAPSTTERSRTQIGKQGTLGNSFTNTKVLTAGRTYDLKVSLTGSNLPVVTTPADNSIMLVMDVTGSMTDDVKYQNKVVDRIVAAKDALKTFVDGTTDRNYVGLATYVICNGKWNTGLFPEMIWSYEGYNNDSTLRKSTGFGVIVKGLTRMTSAEKSNFRSLIDRIDVKQYHGNVCSGARSPLATDHGGGLTAGLAGLLGRSYTGNDTTKPFSLSKFFTDDVSRVMPTVSAPGRKYMVFASDGEQNVYPRSTDRDIYGTSNAHTPINSAKVNNVPVYTMLMGNQAHRDSLMAISSNTGGKYYAGVSGDEIVKNFGEILSDIKEVAANTSITYRLNTEYFDFGDPTKFVFKVRRANDVNAKEEILPNVSCTTSGGTNCTFNATTGVLAINTQFISPEDRLYLYLKVRPRNDSDVRVDNIWVGAVDASSNPTSRVDFTGTTDNYLIANTQVDILPEIGFFLTKSGNIYSLLGIVSNIPEELPAPDRIFAPSVNSLIFVGNPFTQTVKLQFGAGTAPDQRRIDYNEIDYTSLVNSVRDNDGGERVITTPPLSGQDIWNNSPEEVIKYQNASQPLVMPAYNSTGAKKNRVIVSDNDIYLAGNIIVPEGNVLIIMSKQDINIDATVTRVDGILIADGQIQTYCNSAIYTCGKQPSLSTDPALELQGMFVANNGFALGRKGDLRTDPPIAGEVFIFRPDFLLYGSNYIGQHSLLFKEIIQ